MGTKSLLYGLIGFFIGGFIVSVAATTFDKPSEELAKKTEISMSEMTASLKNKQGDDYDKAFIAHMVDHHEGAIEMAKLSASRAKHDEIKQLSQAIIAAQAKEIAEMKQWQSRWGYSAGPAEHPAH